MILDTEFLISFFKKYSKNSKNLEMSEQETQSSGGGSSTKSMPKWADTYPIKRSKANMLGKEGEKWATGMTRGAANQIW